MKVNDSPTNSQTHQTLLLSQIESILDKNLNSLEANIMDHLNVNFEKMLEATQKNTILFFTKCDSCGVYPIPNAKYSCLICDNYNLCSNCEHLHNHPSIKFKTLDYSNKAELSNTIMKKLNENKFSIISEIQGKLLGDKKVNVKDIKDDKEVKVDTKDSVKSSNSNSKERSNSKPDSNLSKPDSSLSKADSSLSKDIRQSNSYFDTNTSVFFDLPSEYFLVPASTFFFIPIILSNNSLKAIPKGSFFGLKQKSDIFIEKKIVSKDIQPGESLQIELDCLSNKYYKSYEIEIALWNSQQTVEFTSTRIQIEVEKTEE